MNGILATRGLYQVEFPTKNEPRLVVTDFIQGTRGGLQSVEFRLFQLRSFHPSRPKRRTLLNSFRGLE